MIENGVVETITLMTLLILLVLNDMLSGIMLEEVRRFRRMVQMSTLPLTLLFLLFAGARIAQLI